MPDFNRSAATRVTLHAILFSSMAIASACSRPADRQADSTRVASSRTGDSAMLTDSAAARSASGVSAASVKLSTEQAEVIDALGSLGGKPIETLDAAAARKQPTPTDAVMAVLKKQGKPITPEPVGTVSNRTIPGPGGALPVRVYTPVGTGVFPVIVYFHGGGFVIATNDTYDGSARALSNATKAVLVSVEYRKAPEHKFPAAHDDAMAAYKWVVANAAALHGDPARIALAGESAGGNLAVSTAVAIKASGARAPVGILAVYPVAEVIR